MRNLKDKSSILTIIAVLILALSLSGSLATIYITRTINSDAETINKLGIIRGSIQKLIKLEMCEVESDKLIEDIESRIDEFENNKAHTYDENEMIKNSIDELTSTWLLLKEAIINYRSKPYANNQDKVLQLSEDLWMKSNNMVYSSQIVSENKIDRYNISYFFLAINLLLGLSIIFLIRRYVKKNLERLVNYDELTAIYNRRYFNESLANEILKAERYDRDFSLIFFDIDHFKKVNDTYGHDVGDDVLKELSDIIMNNIRKSDIFARIGGEEFALIALEMDMQKALKLSEKIRRIVESHNFKTINKITISLGITEFTKGDNKEVIFKRADIALYKAKKEGRNRSEIEIAK